MKRLICIALLLLLSGCSSLRYHIDDPTVIAQNQPIRIVPVKVLAEEGESLDKCVSLVQRVSRNYTEPQAGIVLDICDQGEVKFDRPYNGLQARANDLIEWNKFDPTCDGLLIACVHQPLIRRVAGDMIGYSELGWIDDQWRRYITVSRDIDWVIAHEVFHAFIIHEDPDFHRGVGLMSPMGFAFLPLTPTFHDTYLSYEDREEVLRNKWRKFDNEPVLQ